MKHARFHNTALLIGLTMAAGIAVTPTVSATASAAATNGGTCAAGAIMGIRTADSSLNRWTDATPAGAGGISTVATVGHNWGGVRLLSVDHTTGDLFAIGTDGMMRVYPWSAATGSYTGSGTVIGHGWNDVTQLLPQGDGVLYAITSDGTMKLYVYNTITNAWAAGDGTVIGHGWNSYGALASGGNGIVYAVNKTTGQLWWYKRNAYASTTGAFATPKLVSTSTAWNEYSTMIGAGDGLLYAMKPNGELHWYNNTGAQTGASTWGSDSGAQIGTGWNGYRALTTAADTCQPSTVPTPAAKVTNYDWAKLVLADGGWPQSANNVSVITRWMASEEPPADWYNRNNPLNNGLGSGGGEGLGSYKNLTIAASYAAKNLKAADYSAIAADLSSSAAPATTASAIWHSPWAASHYGYGSMWFSKTVPTAMAPASDW